MRLDKQRISTNYEECSNGVVYDFEKAYVPRGKFMTTLEYTAVTLFDIEPEADRKSYYQLSYPGTLNDNETGNSSTDSINNIFYNSKKPSWKYLSVWAPKDEWIELIPLSKDKYGKITKAKLKPGKYSLQAKAYSDDASNVEMSFNGQPIMYTGKLSDYKETNVIPMGDREGNAFPFIDDFKMVCDTLVVAGRKEDDIIRIKSTGTGQLKNNIKIRALKFEPVGENY